MTFRPAAYAPTAGAAWALIIVGVLAILAGIAAIVFPGLTLLTLVALFGWFALVAGIFEVIHAFSGARSTEGRIVLALWGLATIVVGVLALVLPGITLASFVVLLAAYFFVTGAARSLRHCGGTSMAGCWHGASLASSPASWRSCIPGLPR